MPSTPPRSFTWPRYAAVTGRGLAYFRIFLGLACAGQVLHAWAHAEVFLGDKGLLPLNTIGSWTPFLYLEPGLPTHLGFAAVLLVALAFAAGVPGSKFILPLGLASIRHRIPILETGGDAVLQLSLICCWLLPVERVLPLFTISRTQSARAELSQETVTLGFPLICLQLAVNYASNAAAKLTDPWLTGVAVERSLSNSWHATQLGAWVAQAPNWVLSSATYGTLLVEFLLPLLLLSPWRRRSCLGAAAGLMALLHGSIILTMEVGTFGWAMLAHAPLLFPYRATETPRIQSLPRWKMRLQAGLCVIYIYSMVWSLGMFWLQRNVSPMPTLGQQALHWMRARQAWAMFTIPLDRTFLVVTDARTKNGVRFDPWRERVSPTSHPPDQVPPSAYKSNAFAHVDSLVVQHPPTSQAFEEWLLKQTPAGAPDDHIESYVIWMLEVGSEKKWRVSPQELDTRVGAFDLPLNDALPVTASAHHVFKAERTADGRMVPEGTPVLTPVGASFGPECAYLRLDLKRASPIRSLFIQADAFDEYIVEASRDGEQFFELGVIPKGEQRQYRSRVVSFEDHGPVSAIRLHHRLSRPRTGHISEVALFDHDVLLPELPVVKRSHSLSGFEIPSALGWAEYPKRAPGACAFSAEAQPRKTIPKLNLR